MAQVIRLRPARGERADQLPRPRQHLGHWPWRLLGEGAKGNDDATLSTRSQLAGARRAGDEAVGEAEKKAHREEEEARAVKIALGVFVILAFFFHQQSFPVLAHDAGLGLGVRRPQRGGLQPLVAVRVRARRHQRRHAHGLVAKFAQ